eukprot:TRINITY_DN915_c0_g3_i1.p1 TRINITY_DN915_c0_g3~~TRINITY_DN915_c0_g3_i1.p1  ORF type:complete len:133 (-),score=28.57 TRINITY_DN915_c0_g3_i1:704-1102(-)
MLSFQFPSFRRLRMFLFLFAFLSSVLPPFLLLPASFSPLSLHASFSPFFFLFSSCPSRLCSVIPHSASSCLTVSRFPSLSLLLYFFVLSLIAFPASSSSSSSFSFTSLLSPSPSYVFSFTLRPSLCFRLSPF